MLDVIVSDHELRVCDACGHQNVRPRRAHRAGEIPCACGRRDFTIYDALWVERSIPFTLRELE